MSYQGWTNYETWATNLWLSNDEGLYHEAREMAARAREEAAESVYVLSEALETWVKDMAPDLEASLWSDLLTSALDDVDWREIATTWLADD